MIGKKQRNLLRPNSFTREGKAVCLDKNVCVDRVIIYVGRYQSNLRDGKCLLSGCTKEGDSLAHALSMCKHNNQVLGTVERPPTHCRVRQAERQTINNNYQQQQGDARFVLSNDITITSYIHTQ